MWVWIEQFQKKRALKKLCLDFDAELKKNLESYYVMFQLGRLRFFKMEISQAVLNNPEISLPPEVRRYLDVIESYNKCLKDFTDFETWYAADINRKTKENGIILHAKKEEAQKKFQAGLEEVIKAAVKSWDSWLKQQKMIKP